VVDQDPFEDQASPSAMLGEEVHHRARERTLDESGRSHDRDMEDTEEDGRSSESSGTEDTNEE
jgi:hypothetical protein